jgi:secondary thiamine-phosphate synthase enzyme
LHTGSELVTDLTAEVAAFCRGHGDGLVNIFVPHATAGVALIETGSGTEVDLAATIERMWPVEARYAHSHGSRGHGRDHVLPAFVSPSLVIPVVDGRPALGTWQSVVIVDPNRDNPDRRVRLSFIGS